MSKPKREVEKSISILLVFIFLIFFSISFSEPINLERQIIEKIQEEKICVNSYVRRDFSELTIVKKGVRPKQLSTTLKVYASKYSEGSAQHSALQSIILELDTAGGDDGEDLSGRSKIEQVAAVQGTGELTATFVIYQYRHNHNTNKLLVDALVISGTQRLSVDWMELATEAAIGILPIVLNPTVGVVEIGALVAGGLHALGNRHKIKAATTEINAKALLFKLLIDKGIAKIEDGKYYLMLD